MTNISVSSIIERAGGIPTVATMLSCDQSTVRKWRGNGIPDWHWPALIAAANVTPSELYAANGDAPNWKKRATKKDAA